MAPSSRFHYHTYGDDAQAPLLFLHGFMGNIAEWDQIVPFFSNNFFCIAVDLPGHGRTAIHNQKDYGIENCAANLIAFLDELNISKCRLVSYSMGGRLAFYLAIHFPLKFDKIVLESASQVTVPSALTTRMLLPAAQVPVTRAWTWKPYLKTSMTTTPLN